MLVKSPYNRKRGYILESELAPSQYAFEKPINAYEIDNSVIQAFNYLRFWFGSAIRITSPGRSKAYNTAQKGAATNSKHLILFDENGEQVRPVYALDIQPVDGELQRLKELVEGHSPILYLMGVRGVGFYKTFIHIDTADRGSKYVVWNGVGASLPKMKEFKLWIF